MLACQTDFLFLAVCTMQSDLPFLQLKISIMVMMKLIRMKYNVVNYKHFKNISLLKEMNAFKGLLNSMFNFLQEHSKIFFKETN